MTCGGGSLVVGAPRRQPMSLALKSGTGADKQLRLGV